MTAHKSQDKPSSSKSSNKPDSATSDAKALEVKKPSTGKLSFAELFAASVNKVVSIRRNQEVTGKIVAVSPSEVLVDIGAKSEGVIAGKELTGAEDIISKLTVGDTITATVIYPENDAGQVVLSLRKLSADMRWQELEEKRDSNEDVEVVAVEVNRGGVICDYLGIRGFLPASQLSMGGGDSSANRGEPTSTNRGESKSTTETGANLAELIGKTLTVRVIEVDKSSNRLILSQKAPDNRDISQIQKLLGSINIGDQLKGIVTAVLPFGVFVEVDIDTGPVASFPPTSARSRIKSIVNQQDHVELRAVGSPSTGATRKSKGELAKLEGLVHISEISWEKVEEPAKYFKVGDMVNVMVIAKEESTGRLNLSIKQLTTDPFGEISKKYTKDAKVSGNVVRVTPYGVFIALEAGIEGQIHMTKVPPNVEYEVGQALECTVEAIDTKSRRIALVPIVKQKPVLYR